MCLREFLCDTETEPERKQIVVLLAGYVFGSDDGTTGTVIVAMKQWFDHGFYVACTPDSVITRGLEEG